MTRAQQLRSHWYQDWYQELRRSGPRMSDKQLEACARLATVLLCGEQSAIHIFSREIEHKRQRGTIDAVNELISIERDEHMHELALSRFCDYLPEPVDRHYLKRRAQRFFANLGRTEKLQDQFARIAMLDSAVCKIMWHIENSSLDRVAPLRTLATHIKLDESRHVAVSRRYANALGHDAHHAADVDIGVDLVRMLTPLAASFEEVGVDSDKLFAHLAR